MKISENNTKKEKLKMSFKEKLNLLKHAAKVFVLAPLLLVGGLTNDVPAPTDAPPSTDAPQADDAPTQTFPDGTPPEYVDISEPGGGPSGPGSQT